jgi:acetyl-CoA carboxylase, biotin carboxylase subunit
VFKKILIANRGEIALRVIRACKELGISTVAVYSEADRESLHVRFADEHICIGSARPVDSYLNIAAIISAAEITDAEAIHPGYGFLAENDHFAEVCQSCNIRFIGPSGEAIRLMGDKSTARQTAQNAKVPVVPGSQGIINSPEEAVQLAHQFGFPVILKAAGGGGGRGMRVAHTDLGLKQAFTTAQREADAAFGNSKLYLEKFIEKPRHVEIQIMADDHGNAIHLGERDCSLQRRYQKLIEESPSPAVTPKLRQEMGKAAIRVTQAAAYSGAGTVEFLLADDGSFYFMEMNTRIQVEHPVTEEVTGIDLIKEQIRVATGEKLGLTQKQVKMTGHAIECRINAEDPANNFRPCPGKIEALHLPGGFGIRVDTHAYTEYVVPAFYDSLLCKLVAYGNDREQALRRMERALDEFVAEGITTNASFLRRLVGAEKFRQGDVNTGFVEEFLEKQGP